MDASATRVPRIRRALRDLALAGTLMFAAGPAPVKHTVTIRGHAQGLYLYGPSNGDPVIVSSGDGGWIHLAPHVAELLATHGFFVVGFDTRSYLSSFTSARSSLRVQDEPADFGELASFARRAAGKKPILIGVSEGAGLSVLAAADSDAKANIAGVIALGLPDSNELAWHWRDALIYLTHAAPKEPSFSVADVIDRVAPVPLAAIHSAHDEYVPVTEVEQVLQHAREPKRLWIVSASNHRFSDNGPEFDQRLLEAVQWVQQNAPR